MNIKKINNLHRLIQEDKLGKLKKLAIELLMLAQHNSEVIVKSKKIGKLNRLKLELTKMNYQFYEYDMHVKGSDLIVEGCTIKFKVKKEKTYEIIAIN